jgi:F-type H+-transporting ATPase subunit delta
MADDRNAAYARAMLDVARAEGNLAKVTDELFRFGQALKADDAIRQQLADQHLPAAARQSAVESALQGRALPATVALVSMAVGAGRGGQLASIIDEFVELTAAESGRAVAEVRSAVALSEEQQKRLADAIAKATGRQVDVKVVIDPSVLGGLVTTVGDTVIDGSVRTRLEQFKHAF